MFDTESFVEECVEAIGESEPRSAIKDVLVRAMADPAAVARAQDGTTTVHRHLADKDATDLELALDLVRTEVVPTTGIDHLLVVGAGGGRVDHLVADLLALSAPPSTRWRSRPSWGQPPRRSCAPAGPERCPPHGGSWCRSCRSTVRRRA